MGKEEEVRKTLRLSKALVDDLEIIAKVEERSFHNLLVKIILPTYRDRKLIDPKYADAKKKANQNKK